MYSIVDLQQISFPRFEATGSFLTVYESGEKVPFQMNRVFMVNSHAQSIRGGHAHKQCKQLLVVLQGECKVICDDGMNKKEIILNKAHEGLLIPSTIWAEQQYKTNTILIVLTDQIYSENDYLRDYEQFLRFRNIV